MGIKYFRYHWQHNRDEAGAPYVRSVQQANPLPRDQLPDAGLVFDTLLRRDEVRSHWRLDHPSRLPTSY